MTARELRQAWLDGGSVLPAPAGHGNPPMLALLQLGLQFVTDVTLPMTARRCGELDMMHIVHLLLHEALGTLIEFQLDLLPRYFSCLRAHDQEHQLASLLLSVSEEGGVASAQA